MIGNRHSDAMDIRQIFNPSICEPPPCPDCEKEARDATK